MRAVATGNQGGQTIACVIVCPIPYSLFPIPSFLAGAR
ncbi:hypothetical protein FHS01_004685 [Longimicrobium terrae]|uniref:Uncharacterized protein n=1 Tax=Longimicrobium terrae TaxID=1639882 RepID=A0A841H4I6_9BACT|nr:hypothetical protein [Longimicrobium terrae]MBB6072862.1 hypothetical protein [Longimicrobium terrae]